MWPTSDDSGSGLCCSVLNNFVASADIWKLVGKLEIFDFESKLFDEVNTLDGNGGGYCNCGVTTSIVVRAVGFVATTGAAAVPVHCNRDISVTAVA